VTFSAVNHCLLHLFAGNIVCLVNVALAFRLLFRLIFGKQSHVACELMSALLEYLT